MKRIPSLLSTSIMLSLCFCCSVRAGTRERRPVAAEQTAAERKTIAVTIDDLPLNGAPLALDRLRRMTGELLSAIGEHRVPVVGFVNESQLYAPGEIDARIGVLKAWVDAGAELGNHTFSHLRFTDVTFAEFADDFTRGDTITRSLMKRSGRPVRYFRHPYLRTGATPELEQAFENFIGQRGYRVAPVTVDSSDWMIAPLYAAARRRGDAAEMKRLAAEYLNCLDRKLDYCERAATGLFGRPIRHILLLHSNELNADNFGEVVRVIEERGYRFVTLEQALEDPAYRRPDVYSDTSDWLARWSSSRGRKYDPPVPRPVVRGEAGKRGRS